MLSGMSYIATLLLYLPSSLSLSTSARLPTTSIDSSRVFSPASPPIVRVGRAAVRMVEAEDDEIEDALTFRRRKGKLQPDKPKDNRDKLLYNVVEVSVPTRDCSPHHA